MDHKKDENTAAVIDIVTSIILMMFSIGVALWSLKMPRFEEGWLSAPGLTPLFLSASTFLMSVGLLVSSIRKRGLSQLTQVWKGFSYGRAVSDTKSKRSLWIMFLTGFYLFVLLGRMRFEFATFIYLVSTLFVFWRKAGWLKIIVISAVVPFVASGIFRGVFIVFMPGGSVFDWLLSYLK